MRHAGRLAFVLLIGSSCSSSAPEEPPLPSRPPPAEPRGVLLPVASNLAAQFYVETEGGLVLETLRISYELAFRPGAWKLSCQAVVRNDGPLDVCGVRANMSLEHATGVELMKYDLALEGASDFVRGELGCLRAGRRLTAELVPLLDDGAPVRQEQIARVRVALRHGRSGSLTSPILPRVVASGIVDGEAPSDGRAITGTVDVGRSDALLVLVQAFPLDEAGFPHAPREVVLGDPGAGPAAPLKRQIPFAIQPTAWPIPLAEYTLEVGVRDAIDGPR